MIQDEGQQIEIGSQYMAQRPTVVWEAHGTGPIGLVRVIALPIQEDAEAVELCRTSPGTEDASGSCEIPWSGDQETAVWVQLTQEDGHQAWASPWWLSVDCEAEGVLDPLGRCAPVDSPPESEPEDSAPTDSKPQPPDRRCGCGQGSALLVVLVGWGWRKRRKSESKRA
ncbi:MAG TPA: hypothetical protein PKW90_18380 [Myxococcota bacterium]|nr:hypothetical protein [Myxococcota bacterium]